MDECYGAGLHSFLLADAIAQAAGAVTSGGSEDSPWAARPQGKDKQYDAYWRLDCPSTGSPIEAFFTDFGCWLPAKFLHVNPDGSFSIQWKSDGSTSASSEVECDPLGDDRVGCMLAATVSTVCVGSPAV
ncbi:unnamed protein product [Symbiodinium natans]|uniref:Uncharacterized protein n=1 Tax=Symbiodinium natans TaxID=878477 RepID=A0A812MUD0_9DINO|nr:unnamed protein product [Symbiodinium natans]